MAGANPCFHTVTHDWSVSGRGLAQLGALRLETSFAIPCLQGENVGGLPRYQDHKPKRKVSKIETSHYNWGPFPWRWSGNIPFGVGSVKKLQKLRDLHWFPMISEPFLHPKKYPKFWLSTNLNRTRHQVQPDSWSVIFRAGLVAKPNAWVRVIRWDSAARATRLVTELDRGQTAWKKGKKCIQCSGPLDIKLETMVDSESTLLLLKLLTGLSRVQLQHWHFFGWGTRIQHETSVLLLRLALPLSGAHVLLSHVNMAPKSWIFPLPVSIEIWESSKTHGTITYNSSYEVPWFLNHQMIIMNLIYLTGSDWFSWLLFLRDTGWYARKSPSHELLVGASNETRDPTGPPGNHGFLGFCWWRHSPLRGWKGRQTTSTTHRKYLAKARAILCVLTERLRLLHMFPVFCFFLSHRMSEPRFSVLLETRCCQQWVFDVSILWTLGLQNSAEPQFWAMTEMLQTDSSGPFGPSFLSLNNLPNTLGAEEPEFTHGSGGGKRVGLQLTATSTGRQKHLSSGKKPWRSLAPVLKLSLFVKKQRLGVLRTKGLQSKTSPCDPGFDSAVAQPAFLLDSWVVFKFIFERATSCGWLKCH